MQKINRLKIDEADNQQNARVQELLDEKTRALSCSHTCWLVAGFD